MVVQVNDVGMVASELRIGNWVITENGNYYKVTGFDIYKADENDEHGLKPIPLTEEILLKIEGVEKLDNIEWEYLIKISAAKLCFRFNAGHCYTQFNDTYLGDMISCLHELQNFCHVFKKELNVKL